MDVNLKGTNENGTPSSAGVSSIGYVSAKALTPEEHGLEAAKSFTTSFANTTAANSGDQSGIYLLTPAAASGVVNMTASFYASLGSSLAIYEAPTLAANTGTHAVAIYNRDRNSTTKSTVKDNATAHTVDKVTTMVVANFGGTWAVGTTIRTEPVTPAVKATVTPRFKLKASTAYVFALLTTQGAATDHKIYLDWFEKV